MASHLQVTPEKIAEFCRKYHIQKLAFFGSVLRDDFCPTSDVDVLAWFEPEHVPGLFSLVTMAMEMGQIVGRPVDLRTPEDLSQLFRQEVLAQAEVQYAA